MSFVSTGNKTVGSDGPAITTPPIVGENNGVSSGAAVASVTDAAEQMAEQAVELLFGELPEPSGLVKAAVAAAQAAAVAAGISDIAGAAQDVMSSLISGPGVHNVTVSGSAVPLQMLLFASLNGSETLGALFTYVVQLKTPDTLNLGYVSPAANLPLKPTAIRICRSSWGVPTTRTPCRRGDCREWRRRAGSSATRCMAGQRTATCCVLTTKPARRK